MTRTVAIIGSGMAGLAAARLMHDAGHQVTLFEAHAGHGMDSHSLLVDGGIVDAPLRVMNPSLWPHTLALAAHVGVAAFPVRTYMSCNWFGMAASTGHPHLQTWFKSQRTAIGNLPTVADLRFLNRKNLTLITGLWQLKTALRQFKQHPQQDMTLAEFASQYQFEPLFWHGLVLPVVNTICTCALHQIAQWPARPLLTFLEKLLDGEPLLRLHGGTPAFVRALSAGINVLSGARVTQVALQGEQVLVGTVRGDTQYYDTVIVATPTHQLGFLNAQDFAVELALLSQFEFARGELVIHRDQHFMPAQRRDWTILNYSMNQQFKQLMFSIWINQIEPTLIHQPPVFQTWNPVVAPQPDKVLSRVSLTRAIVNRHTASLVQQLQQLHQQPGRRVFFCGSWSCDGLPVLESAVTSAMQVANRLGVATGFNNQPPLIQPVAGLPR